MCSLEFQKLEILRETTCEWINVAFIANNVNNSVAAEWLILCDQLNYYSKFFKITPEYTYLEKMNKLLKMNKSSSQIGINTYG